MGTKDCNCGCADCTGQMVATVTGGLSLSALGFNLTPGMTPEQQRASIVSQVQAMPSGHFREATLAAINTLPSRKVL